VKTSVLHSAVSAYMTDYLGYSHPWSKRKLSNELLKRGTFATVKADRGQRYIAGLDLLPNWRERLDLTPPPSDDYYRTH